MQADILAPLDPTKIDRLDLSTLEKQFTHLHHLQILQAVLY